MLFANGASFASRSRAWGIAFLRTVRFARRGGFLGACGDSLSAALRPTGRAPLKSQD